MYSADKKIKRLKKANVLGYAMLLIAGVVFITKDPDNASTYRYFGNNLHVVALLIFGLFIVLKNHWQIRRISGMALTFNEDKVHFVHQQHQYNFSAKKQAEEFYRNDRWLHIKQKGKEKLIVNLDDFALDPPQLHQLSQDIESVHKKWAQGK
ncbi:hypothetical protein [Persicobacter psychrovividus]|uniref:YcxB-like protein domain-containing protein n=1 Tax=Persicobacter psychrovividus TaxID=387638 RepID=A0ABM7VAV5_9BACT|nr:hypothetical protein PEPS_01050 [Persicobacter psychrovividus]